MSGMDVQSSFVAWASFVVTTIGLGGLVTQASAISDQMDPFYSTRSAEYLGVWFKRQRSFPWWRIAKPPPRGPVITAKAATGFCGSHTIYIMRIPPSSPGKAGWSTLLAMFNGERPLGPLPPIRAVDQDAAEKAALETVADSGSGIAADGWPFLEQQPLTRHNTDACVKISRATLIVMLVMTNGRPVFEYSSATGYRAGFASYVGQWYITWPIGEEAVVKFAQHDSLGASEVFPRYFPQRVDRCCEMICGIVSSASTGLKVAFCGRKPAGRYRLQLGQKGFQGAHGARHLYNMMGGKAYEFDFLYALPVADRDGPADDGLTLTLPPKEGRGSGLEVRLTVPAAEAAVVRHALDCLSWTSLSWSIHRGLRDVLVAFAKPVMDAHRAQMGRLLERAVRDRADLLQARGWDADFVRNNMGHMAASAMLAGAGNSGDAVRVVTDVVSAMVGEWDFDSLDTVNFWRRDPEKRPQPGEELDKDAIVALAKVFVLEWSQEFDYQCYHYIPIELLLG